MDPRTTVVTRMLRKLPTASPLEGPQVRLDDSPVLGELFERARSNDLPHLHHVDNVGEVLDVGEVLLDQEQRGAGRLELSDAPVDGIDHDRGEAQRGLIDHQQAWLAHQPPPPGSYAGLTAPYG